jgi:hypothetical protein
MLVGVIWIRSGNGVDAFWMRSIMVWKGIDTDQRSLATDGMQVNKDWLGMGYDLDARIE